MNDQDYNISEQRNAKYKKLREEKAEIYETIRLITENDKNGPDGQGPFTGNTRESRQIKSIHINFSRTRGGTVEVDKFVGPLNIEAWEFKEFLESKLRAKLKIIEEEIEKL